MSLRIGFIGLGIMGSHMARHIYEAGFPVTVWNRTASKMEQAKQWGAHTAHSPKEVAEQSDLVITIVGDTPDVREVVTGENGVLAGANPGMIYIDMSTISPEAAKELAVVAKEQGVDMLDAPVTGGDVGAKNGTLSIMVGGEEDVFLKAKPILETMSRSLVHVGPNGAGQTVKACNQILCGVHIAAVTEAMAFAAKAGVDLEKMLAVTTSGSGSSWALENYGPRILKGDLNPGFSIRFQQKDLRIVLQEAEKMELPLLVTAVVNQLLRSQQAHGGNELGTQSFIQVIEQLANQSITPKS
ncbi:3-hydroxyisobutyrate dehydrogenase [Seinonella peptonophila]|uniref:3-hydroxyisobutyrate dehydrogenase n=1 Tax=Seinonella peptonophila TaxID=112248 RepID=A0A1M4YC77_9BACL|nr:NAD(P)-dependent oxidoreductase [Seinonella peptonophila]SHF03218.1 3-hydroxyisobutyrate dehydrogenase [Seinonella peptonophila]